MQEKIIEWVQPQSDWHIVEVTPTTMELTAETATADLLICSYLSGAQPDMSSFLASILPILQPGGWLAVADVIVPGNRLRGKKAALQRRAGDYINAWFDLRQSRNGRFLNMDQWLDLLRVASVREVQHELQAQSTDFHTWLADADVAPKTGVHLRAMLKQAPAPVIAALTPQFANDRIAFYLTEGIFVGRFRPEAGL